MRAQRRTVEPPYSAFSAGLSPRAAGEQPDLVAHLVEEPLPRVGVGGAERPGLVHHDAGRARETDAAADQPGGVLEVVVPQEVVGDRQPPLADHAPTSHAIETNDAERIGTAARRAAAARALVRRAHRAWGAGCSSGGRGRRSRPPGWRAPPAARPGYVDQAVDQPLGRRRRRDGVVVEQPDQVGRVGQRPLDAGREAAGAAGVRGQVHDARGRRSARAAARSVPSVLALSTTTTCRRRRVCAASGGQGLLAAGHAGSRSRRPRRPGHSRGAPYRTGAAPSAGARQVARLVRRVAVVQVADRAADGGLARLASSPSWAWWPGRGVLRARCPCPRTGRSPSVTIDWIFGDVGVAGADRRGHERDRAHAAWSGPSSRARRTCRARRRAGRW